MLALGSVKSAVTDSVKSGRVHFDMHGFLTRVVLADLSLSGRSPCGARRLGARRPAVRSVARETGEPGTCVSFGGRSFHPGTQTHQTP